MGEISNNLPIDLLGTNIEKVLNHVDNHCLQYEKGLILLT